VESLLEAIGEQPVDLLFANAGEGLGDGFLNQDFARVRHMIDTNITGTLALVQQVAQRMRDRGRGRILFTGSIAGTAPGPYQAAYGGTKAFLNSFAEALRQELSDIGVNVTVLMPGATDTRFFARAGMTDTRVGAGRKQDPASVAQAGWQAVMAGDDKVVAGAANKAQVLLARVLPPPVSAKRFGHISEPGSAQSGRQAAVVPLVLLGSGLAAGALALLARSGGRERF
jgi:short-subunit dehydrogenase